VTGGRTAERPGASSDAGSRPRDIDRFDGTLTASRKDESDCQTNASDTMFELER
jgi:hypothetical protein